VSDENNKEIRKLYRNVQFDRILSGNKTALIDSQLVATNLLGNNKADS